LIRIKKPVSVFRSNSSKKAGSSAKGENANHPAVGPDFISPSNQINVISRQFW
jgi:hypothetical protein